MTIKLTRPEILTWQNRFNAFNDAVVRRWSIGFLRGTANFEVDVETRDMNARRSGWSLVTLRMHACNSLNFVRSNQADYDVLSNGLHVVWLDGLFAFEFGNFADVPTSIAELLTSPCHVTSQDVEWDATELPANSSAV